MDNETPSRNILVVEDEGIIAMDIVSSLQRLGYKTVATVNNGRDAIATAQKTQPDLILMDILLKGELDGIEAAMAIKEDCNIPIVYLTANTDEQTFQRAKTSGPFGYLLKPFEERELHTTIETAIYKHQTDQELQRYRDHLEELVEKRTAELNNAHAALTQSEENYRTIFDNANDAIFVIDATCIIRDANQQAMELTGKSAPEIIGSSLHSLVADGRTLDSEKNESILRKALAGKPQIFEWLVKQANNNSVWVEMSVKNASINGANVLLAVARDISLRKESEQLLLEAKNEAEKTNRLKNEFLANMSHEIRTPMNAVLGMANIALSTNLTADQRTYLEMILEAGGNLLDLLNNVLDYSKIEAGHIDLAQQPFNLRQQIESAIRAISDRAKTKGLTIQNKSSQLPYSLIGDCQRVRQIVCTLLDNAVKFTQTGHIEVAAKTVAQSDEKSEIEITVTDSGIGIPKDKQVMIFDLFTQADGSFTRKHDGAGLGLAVTKRLVRLMKGRIEVFSEDGKGSSFQVVLPFPIGPAL